MTAPFNPYPPNADPNAVPGPSPQLQARVKETRDQLPAVLFGIGVGYAACKLMMREAVKAASVKSADILLRDDGASVILLRFANGAVTTLVKEVAKDVVKV